MQLRFPVMTGLLLTALAGCQSYTPYGYSYMNGGYNYGNGYAAPPPSGPTYIQPQPAAPYSPRLMQPAPPPGTSYSAPRGMSPSTMMQPAPRPSGGQSLGATAIPPGTPSSRIVPQPYDGPSGNSPAPIAVPPSGGQPPSTLGAPSGLDEDEDDFKKPVGSLPSNDRTSNRLNDDTQENIRKMGPESFTDPKKTPIGKKEGMTKPTSFESSDAASMHRPNPYAFDSESYKWLRGVLDYDAVDKRWHITYSNNPQDKDTYGGSLTLADNPQLEEKFLNNDVVLVDGSVDVNQRDRFGKPVYKIRKINRIQPKASMAADPRDDR